MRQSYLLSLLVAGCASSPKPDTFMVSMSSTVDAGMEAYRCQFFTTPNKDAFVVESAHMYTPGSHHLLVFRTDLTAIPAGLDQAGDCYAGDEDYMSHIRGVVYGSQVPTGEQIMPPGVGLELQPSSVLLMQTHYLNATMGTLDSHAEVTFTLSDGKDITQHAGVFFFYDPFIDVPPDVENASAQMRCLIPGDVTLLSGVSHYHKRGVSYGAYLDPPSGPMAATPFYTSTSWDSPVPLSTSMPIGAGTRLRFNCDYDNSGGPSEYFQGPSAESNEMCIFTGAYYPALTNDDELCKTSPDMFGSGQSTCNEMLTCVQACPPGTQPTNLGTEGAAVDPCWQKCFVQSCPGSSGKLLALSACTQANCPTECATAGSSDCMSCAESKCLAVGAACLSDSCM